MSIVNECIELLRIRQSCGRQPKYFYMNGYDYTALWCDMQDMQMTTITGLAREPTLMAPPHLCKLQILGIPVEILDLPQGYILCSETRLH